MEQSSNNTCQAIALVEQYFIPIKSNALSTQKSDFSIVLKIAKVASRNNITVTCEFIFRLSFCHVFFICMDLPVVLPSICHLMNLLNQPIS